jgi:hypothetical protein
MLLSVFFVSPFPAVRDPDGLKPWVTDFARGGDDDDVCDAVDDGMKLA